MLFRSPSFVVDRVGICFREVPLFLSGNPNLEIAPGTIFNCIAKSSQLLGDDLSFPCLDVKVGGLKRNLLVKTIDVDVLIPLFKGIYLCC